MKWILPENLVSCCSNSLLVNGVSEFWYLVLFWSNQHFCCIMLKISKKNILPIFKIVLNLYQTSYQKSETPFTNKPPNDDVGAVLLHLMGLGQRYGCWKIFNIFSKILNSRHHKIFNSLCLITIFKEQFGNIVIIICWKSGNDMLRTVENMMAHVP